MKLDFFCKSTGRSSEFRTRACLSKSHVLEVIQFNHTLINEHESKLIYKGWCTVFNWIILEMRVRMFAPELKSFESSQLSATPSSRKIGSQEWRKKAAEECPRQRQVDRKREKWDRKARMIMIGEKYKIKKSARTLIGILAACFFISMHWSCLSRLSKVFWY